MLRQIVFHMRRQRRPLLAFHLYFALLALCALTPISAWLLSVLIRLSGQSMVGNEDLVVFLLQPAGAAWLLVFGTLAATLAFIEHAGMQLIVMDNGAGRGVNASRALWLVLKRLPAVLRLAGLQVAAHLLLAAPMLALLTGSFIWLLGDYDPYYVLSEHPAELWSFLGIAVLLGLLAMVLNGNLYLRWVLALPALLAEGLGPRAALARSMSLTAGVRLQMAVMVVGVAGLVALLPVITSVVFDGTGALLLGLLPERYFLLIPVMLTLVVLFAIIGVLVTFAGVSANSLLIWLLYQRRSGHVPGLRPEDGPQHAGVWAWGLEGMLVLFVVGQLVWVSQAFDTRDQVQITAHRGSSWAAPENTRAAIERAIDDGAHYVELDVRQTADGTLVMLHDRDLRRVAGLPYDIWNVNYDEIRDQDIGSWFDPAFAGERLLTLPQAIELLRGRARLYLEIKTGAQTPTLIPDVIRVLREADIVAETIVAALSPEVLHEVRALAPEIRTSLLVHSAIGNLEVQPFDVLALRDGLVTPPRAHRVRRSGSELHVWTVNDRARMGRFLDLGVDNIITDRPDVLAELLETREDLSDAERLLLRVRNWIW